MKYVIWQCVVTQEIIRHEAVADFGTSFAILFVGK